MPSNQPIVLLREVSGDRYLPIWIGPGEATAIAFAQQGMAPARPLTHDLFKDVLEAVGQELTEVRITDLREGVFYAELVFASGVEVSARPSDAIALALRTGTPIYGSDGVLDDAGIEYREVEQAFAGYVYGDSTCGQRAVYGLGLTGIPVFNVNNNCSTGSSALMLGRQAIEAGAECVLVVGFEQMERGALGSKWDDRTNPLDKHAGVMMDVQGFNAAPPAAQMFGGAGVVSGMPVEKLYREIRALRIYEGATEVQKLIIARELLKA